MRTKVMSSAAALAAAALLTACSATTATDAYVEQPMSDVAADGAMAEGVLAGGAPAAPTTSQAQDRAIVKTAYVSMRVEDVGASAARVRELVRARNGLIANEDSQATSESPYASLTVQVPAADLDAFLDDVAGLGTVDSVSVSASDVTAQVVDLDARIGALQASIERMTQLLAEATRIEDLLAIETQLSQRQAELDSLTAQRTWLGEQVALSTVTVSITPQTAIASVDAPGFVSGLRSGWAAFTSAIAVAVTGAGFFLPFLLALLLILVPALVVIARRSRRIPDGAEDGTQSPAAELTPTGA
ncbi:MAG: DUF4349 domain-containing protein [Candidatus Nanopelagicales bacterium]